MSQTILVLLLIGIATSASAEEVKLSGEQIKAFLPTIIAVGEKTRQSFSKAGATTYTDRGRDSYGAWRV